MFIDYRFEELTRAMLAKAMLMGQSIPVTLTSNVHLGGLKLVHRLEVEDENAEAAERILDRFGLMGTMTARRQ